jgi:ribonucleoside-diphosphate reductase beta chain
MTKPQITTPTESFVIRYPEAVDFANKQWSIFWLPDEIKLEKDVHDILVNLTESEKHGVITVLKLFTLYELFAGKDYWGGRVMTDFPRPEIARMASQFAAFELGVHQPFYARINELLGLASDEFYTSYADNPVLKSRMSFVDDVVNYNSIAPSLAAFSMVEGAVLYSSFAFLKHFQSQGKNKLLNIVRGINFSVRDENLHALAGAWLYKTYCKESGYTPPVEQIYELATHVREHEHQIVDMIFEKGKIDGITPVQLKHFVDSRINGCLKNLGVKVLYEVSYNPIGEWFYSGINNFQYNDFFTGMGSQYHRNWNEKAFGWKVDNVSPTPTEVAEVILQIATETATHG